MDLQVEEDPRLQWRVWAFERAGWAVMAVLVLAALLGVVGTGPLSSQSRSAADGSLVVRYERFARAEALQTVEVQVRGQVVRGGQVELTLDRAWLDGVRLEHVTPAPREVRGRGGELVYVFSATGEQLTAVFDFTVQGIGPAHGRVRATGGEPVTFSQFFYP